MPNIKSNFKFVVNEIEKRHSKAQGIEAQWYSFLSLVCTVASEANNSDQNSDLDLAEAYSHCVEYLYYEFFQKNLVPAIDYKKAFQDLYDADTPEKIKDVAYTNFYLNCGGELTGTIKYFN